MCYNTIMEPEIRKETQDLEIKKDTPKASAPTPRERFAGIYPDADPRKFNSHTTEQEIAEYVNTDHTQKISNEGSADKEHIRAAYFGKKQRKITWSKKQQWQELLVTIVSVILFLIFLAICGYFINILIGFLRSGKFIQLR